MHTLVGGLPYLMQAITSRLLTTTMYIETTLLSQVDPVTHYADSTFDMLAFCVLLPQGAGTEVTLL